MQDISETAAPTETPAAEPTAEAPAAEAEVPKEEKVGIYLPYRAAQCC